MMLPKLLASIQKELRLLLRDRAGLILLFIMPAFLVVVITLIQDKVTNTRVDLLLVDDDHGTIGNTLRNFLTGNDTIHLVENIEGMPISTLSAQKLVANSRFQFAVFLPSGLSQATYEKAQDTAVKNLFPERQGKTVEDPPEMVVWFDPTVHGSFRAAVRSILQQVMAAVKARLLVEKSLTMLPEKLSLGRPQILPGQFPGLSFNAADLLPQLFEDKASVAIREQFCTNMGFVKQPTAVQQNVPAWAIFGIFFIAVPLAGSLIKERQNGTLTRLKVLPVSYVTIMSGKIAAYTFIGMVQAAVILLAGMYLLPCFGLPSFDPGNRQVLLFVMMLCVVVAACGYGVLLGSAAKTYEQIAVFGPVSIVIGAALGGIMVPIYALPEMMRPVCMFSPLYWGQNGFYDILLRAGDLRTMMPEGAYLLAFGIGSTIVASMISAYKKHTV